MASPTQLKLGFDGTEEVQEEEKKSELSNGRANKLSLQDRAFHDWYRFVLSFPPHLVREYITKFELSQNSVVLDPFCGTGTTLVEAKLTGMKAIGLEGNPFPHFASSVKTEWNLDADLLSSYAQKIADEVLDVLKSQGIDDNFPLEIDNKKLRTLSPEAEKLILTNSISPLPLHKTLVLFELLKKHETEPYYRHLLLALGNALVFKISNLHFGPEVGVRNPKIDVPVVSNWLVEVDKMIKDLRKIAGKSFSDTQVHLTDARNLEILEPNSVDAVITSPPYPNEKDYTRITRLESVLLGFINNKKELQELKRKLVRSNTRGIYKDDDDDKWVTDIPEIQRIAQEIEKRRIELGKDSGFEKLYPKAAKLYFGGMAKHLSSLRKVLRPGARLAYVVGDQASYLRVMIRTGQLLGDIAQKLGYELVDIDLFRTRLATATKEQLREEVVILKWSG
ncbi:MAG: site-specific DNA-methyltransferase [Anaerolineae bacterium]|nr:site-specific DNA-methyltransferase [Anaerolineae bacterium]MCI0609998.1 site-specific DNA-methyltransferase [Anaerolineae bacterium]